MTPQEIAEKLRGIESWEQCSSWLRGAFVKEMEGKQYGYSPLHAAWHWFYAGYEVGTAE